MTAQRPAIHPVVIAPDLVPERQGTVAFVGHVKRDGEWTLPRLFRAVAVMGGVEIDLTRARVGPGTSHIEVRAFMGSVEILVPPDLRIEYDGDPFVGSFDIKRHAQSTTSPDAPLIRVSGLSILGAVVIKIVDPNAPGWFDKLRSRWSARRA